MKEVKVPLFALETIAAQVRNLDVVVFYDDEEGEELSHMTTSRFGMSHHLRGLHLDGKYNQLLWIVGPYPWADERNLA